MTGDWSTPGPRPWIIWVESLRGRALMLLIYKPRHQRFLRWFGRWSRPSLFHKDGPIFYKTPHELIGRVSEMVDSGKSFIPDDQDFRIALSLRDANEIIRTEWLAYTPPKWQK